MHKFFLKVFIILAVLFVAGMVALDLPVTRHYLLERINKQLNTKFKSDLSLNSFEVGLFPPSVHLYNVVLTDRTAAKTQFFKANRISIFPSYLSALLFQFKIGDLQVVAPVLEINKILDYVDDAFPEENQKKDPVMWPFKIDIPIKKISILQAQVDYSLDNWSFESQNVNLSWMKTNASDYNLYTRIKNFVIKKEANSLIPETDFSLDVSSDRSGIYAKYIRLENKDLILASTGKAYPKVVSGSAKKIKGKIDHLLDEVDEFFVSKKNKKLLGFKGELDLDIIKNEMSGYNNLLDKLKLNGSVTGKGKIKFDHLFKRNFMDDVSGNFKLTSDNATIDKFLLKQSTFDLDVEAHQLKFKSVSIIENGEELAVANGVLGLTDEMPMSFNITPKNLRLSKVMEVVNADFDFVDFLIESKSLELVGRSEPFSLAVLGDGVLSDLRFKNIPHRRYLDKQQFRCKTRIELFILKKELDFHNVGGKCGNDTRSGMLQVGGKVKFDQDDSLALNIKAAQWPNYFFNNFMTFDMGGESDWEVNLRNPSGNLSSKLRFASQKASFDEFSVDSLDVDGRIFSDRIDLNKFSFGGEGQDTYLNSKATFYLDPSKKAKFSIQDSKVPAAKMQEALDVFFDVKDVSFGLQRFRGRLSGPIDKPLTWKTDFKFKVSDLEYKQDKLFDQISANVKRISKTTNFAGIKAKKGGFEMLGDANYQHYGKAKGRRSKIGYHPLDTVKGAFRSEVTALPIRDFPFIGKWFKQSKKFIADVKVNTFLNGKVNSFVTKSTIDFDNMKLNESELPDLKAQVKASLANIDVQLLSGDKTAKGSFKLDLKSQDFSMGLNLNNFLLNFLMSKKIKFDPRNYSYVNLTLDYKSNLNSMWRGNGSFHLKNFILNIAQDFSVNNSRVKYRLVEPKLVTIRNGQATIPGDKISLAGNIGKLDLWAGKKSINTLDYRYKGTLNLSVLPAISNSIEIASGIIAFDGRVFQRGNQIDVETKLVSQNNQGLSPSISLRGARPPFKDIDLEATINRKGLRVEKLIAKKGEGTVRVSGNHYFNPVSGKSLMNVSLRKAKFSIDSKFLKEIDTEITGDFSISGSSKPYQLRGGLDLEYVRASRDFNVKKEILNLIRSQEVNSITLEDTPMVDFDLNIKSNSSIFLKNRNMDFVMSTNIRLIGDSLNPNLVGLATVDRGKFVFSREFRIERGNLSFDQNTKIDPNLDIQAVADISSRRITMNITGRSSNAKVDLSAEPATMDDGTTLLKKWDILVLLTTGKLPNANSGSVASQTLSILASTLEGELEKLFALSGQDVIRQIYLDFEVSETSGNLVPKLIVPVNITDEMSVNVSVNSDERWELSSDYSVNENIYLSGSLFKIEDGNETSQFDTFKFLGKQVPLDAAFDLKFRFNYQ